MVFTQALGSKSKSDLFIHLECRTSSLNYHKEVGVPRHHYPFADLGTIKSMVSHLLLSLSLPFFLIQSSIYKIKDY